jgi:hypothetical protein
MPHGKKHYLTRKNKSRKMRGGSSNMLVGNNYEQVSGNGGPSGWNYVNKLVGGLDQQYNGALMGNGSGNQLAINSRSSIMSGGRHRKNRRGGYLSPAISDSIVPLGLLAAQQMYGKRLKRPRKSRRTRRTRRR